jgi:hypothetical protein
MEAPSIARDEQALLRGIIDQVTPLAKALQVALAKTEEIFPYLNMTERTGREKLNKVMGVSIMPPETVHC